MINEALANVQLSPNPTSKSDTLLYEEYFNLTTLQIQGTFSEAWQNRSMNKYSNVLPYDDNCYNNPSYYNASWMGQQRSYIAAQGPFGPYQVTGFKAMVAAAKANTVLMLTNTMESERKKCDDYVSDKPLVQTLLIAGLQVEVRQVDGFTHYWVKEWNDHQTITPQQLLGLIAKMGSTAQAPLVCHCSAGIGRTGTFLVAMEAIRRGFDDPDVVYKVAKELRSPPYGREGTIQTAEQYILAYKTWELAKQQQRR